MKDKYRFFKLIRWKNILIIAFTMVAMRYLIIIPILQSFNTQSTLSHYAFVFYVLATILLAAAGYIINDYFDMKIDKINKFDKLIIKNNIQKKEALSYHIYMNILGMICAVIACIIAKITISYLIVFVCIAVLLWLYSAVLKRKFLIGNLLVSSFIACVPVSVVFYEYLTYIKNNVSLENNEGLRLSIYIIVGLSIFAFIYNFIREIVKDCEDIEGDRAFGVKSFPIVIGTKATNIMNSAIILITSFLMLYAWKSLVKICVFFQNNIIAEIYIYLCIFVFPILLFIYSIRAKHKKDYSLLSSLLKIYLVLGLCFCIIVYLSVNDFMF